MTTRFLLCERARHCGSFLVYLADVGGARVRARSAGWRCDSSGDWCELCKDGNGPEQGELKMGGA
jgi:hypothetical protein